MPLEDRMKRRIKFWEYVKAGVVNADENRDDFRRVVERVSELLADEGNEKPDCEQIADEVAERLDELVDLPTVRIRREGKPDREIDLDELADWAVRAFARGFCKRIQEGPSRTPEESAAYKVAERRIAKLKERLNS